MPSVKIVPPDEGTFINFRGARIRRAVSRAESEDAWAIGTGEQDAGFDNPRHVHDEPEAFFVIRGRYAFYTENEEREAVPGTFVFIPAGAVHGFRTLEDSSELLCVWPASVERAFFGDDANRA